MRLLPSLALLAPLCQALGQPPWRLTVDQTIGRDNDSSYQWTTIRNVLVSSTGMLAVVDPSQLQVSVYDHSGQFRARFGRRGSGPGEFLSISGAGMRGDTIWVADKSQFRLTLFDLAGRVVRTMPIQFDPRVMGLFRSTGPAALLADGTVLVTPTPTSEILQKPPSFGVPLLRLTEKGHLRDTLAKMRFGKTAIAMGPGSVFAWQPFTDGTLWSVDPTGTTVSLVDRTAATAPTATYGVTLYGLSGSVFTRRYSYVATPVTRAKIDSVVEAGVQELARTTRRGRTATDRELVAAGLYAPAFYPPIRSVVATYDGRTIIGLRATHPDSAKWLVLDTRGEPSGLITTGSATTLLQIRGGFAWAVTRSVLDEPRVVRYRIVR
jgi:hypothetical protein